MKDLRLLLAPNAFKGSLSPVEAARAMAVGAVQAAPDASLDLAPLSDGGDGFLETMAVALGAETIGMVARGPLHEPVGASFALQRGAPGGDLGIIEMAEAAGLRLLSAAGLDPLGASTGGVGEVMLEARWRGARQFLVGIGGSATTDGGTGLARALGYRFLDGGGHDLPEGGGHLHRLARIDGSAVDPAWLGLPIRVACDVDSPLTGPHGAAAVFGPQKGAGPAQVEVLERGLVCLAAVIRRDLGVDVEHLPGGGAAGGLGAGLVAFLGATLVPGTDAVLEALDISRRLERVDLVLTGEGRLDGQSGAGKAPAVIGRQARAAGIRVVALVGSTGPGWEALVGDAFDEVQVVTPAGSSLEEAIAGAGANLSAATARVLTA